MISGKSEAEQLLNLSDCQVINYAYYTKLMMEDESRIKMFWANSALHWSQGLYDLIKGDGGVRVSHHLSINTFRDHRDELMAPTTCRK